MPTLHNADLLVTTDRFENRATVVVTCDVDFTDVEVNAMNLLDLRYTLICTVYNRHIFDEDIVVAYRNQTLPRVSGAARHREHVVLEKTARMHDLHERPLGKDKFFADLRLRNGETGEEQKLHTHDIWVDLAA